MLFLSALAAMSYGFFFFGFVFFLIVVLFLSALAAMSYGFFFGFFAFFFALFAVARKSEACQSKQSDRGPQCFFHRMYG